MAPRVFIDGEAGTTGLQIRARVADRRDIEVVSIADEHRKDRDRRAELLNSVDVAILCLPDDAAREAVSLIDNPKTRVIDTSTAHRIAPGWVYGFPELESGQAARIAEARFVANVGCYAVGTISLLRPLMDAGLIPDDYRLQINAISGYSGGGRALIARFEDADAPNPVAGPYYVYGLGLEHKHVPEIETICRLTHRPIFVPSVGQFRQGMLIQIPLHLPLLTGSPSVDKIREVLAERYAGQKFVEVADADKAAAAGEVYADEMNGTNTLRLYVFGAERRGHALLVSTLDNLGKGASGSAVQNLNLMLGLAADTGLDQALLAAE